MKTIKFRLVKNIDNPSRLHQYSVQRKTFFGWRYLRHEVYSLAGSVRAISTFMTREEAIISFKDDFKFRPEFAKWIQYPTIKISV